MGEQDTIDIRYWAIGRSGKPKTEFEIYPPNEAAEILNGIDPGTVDTEINEQSNYIRLTPAVLPSTRSPGSSGGDRRMDLVQRRQQRPFVDREVDLARLGLTYI